MAAKQITFNTEAREKLKQGIDELANAVKVTLGPKGRTWLSRNLSALRPSLKTVFRWLKKSNWKMQWPTWARKW